MNINGGQNMAYKTGELSEQITIRVSENLKAQLLYLALLERKNLAEYIRDLLEEAVKDGRDLETSSGMRR